jgi:plastocyanin domain-containing protein
VAAASCDKKAEPTPPPTPVATAATAGQGGGLQVTVNEHGFAPGSVELPKGPAGSTVPVTFLRMTDETCAKEVVFPDVGIKKDLPLRKPVVVDVPADTARKLTFQCGMAMYKGAVVVK